MRNLHLLLFVVYHTLVSCNSAKKSENSANTITQVEVDQLVRSLGTVQQNSEHKINFQIKNVGAENLQINKITSDCSCAVPEWNTEPIKPNDSTTIAVNFNARTLGLFQKIININLNTNEGALVLTIRGNVIKDSL